MMESFSINLSQIEKNNILKVLESVSQILRSEISAEEKQRILTTLMPKFTAVVKDLIAKSCQTRAEKALAKFNSILSIFPDQYKEERVQVYTQIAEAYKEAFKFKASKNLLLQALRIPADHKNTYLLLCSLMNHLNDRPKALAYVEKACSKVQEHLIETSLKNKINPESVKELAISYYKLGQQLELIQRSALAIDWYTKAQTILENHGQEHTALLQNVRNTLQAAKISSNGFKKTSSCLRNPSRYAIGMIPSDYGGSIERKTKPKSARGSLNIPLFPKKNKTNRTATGDIITERGSNSQMNNYLMVFKPEENKKPVEKPESKSKNLRRKYTKEHFRHKKLAHSEQFDRSSASFFKNVDNLEQFNKQKFLNKDKIPNITKFEEKNKKMKSITEPSECQDKIINIDLADLTEKESSEIVPTNIFTTTDLKEDTKTKNTQPNDSEKISTEKNKKTSIANTKNTMSKNDRNLRKYSNIRIRKNVAYSAKCKNISMESNAVLKNQQKSEPISFLNHSQEKEHNPAIDSISLYDIAPIVKIQSWIRGFLARRRAKRLREQLKLKIIFKQKVVIDGEEYIATVLRNIRIIIINLKNNQHNLSLELKGGTDYMKVLSNIMIDHGNIVVKTQEHELRHIKKKKMKFSGQVCKLHFYSNEGFTLLLIKGRFKDSSHYIREENISAYSVEQMKMFIRIEIIPNLYFDRSTLFLDKSREKTPKDLITSALTYFNFMHYESRVFTLKTPKRTDLMVEIDTSSGMIKQYYDIKKVLPIFNLETTEEFLKDPHLFPLALTFENSCIVLHKPFSLDHVYLCTRKFNSSDYIIKIYKLETHYFIVAIGDPHLRNVIISSVDFFVNSKTESDYSYVVKRLSESKGRLSVSQTARNNEYIQEKAALVIQKYIRRFKVRASVKLYMLKYERSSGILISRKAKIVQGHPCIFSLFKRDNIYIIEGAKQGENKTMLKKIRNPYKYISKEKDLSELLNIVSERNNKLCMPNSYSRPGSKIIGRLDSEEKEFNIVLNGEKYTVRFDRKLKYTLKVELEAHSGGQTLFGNFPVKQLNEILGEWSLDTLKNNISIEKDKIMISKETKNLKIAGEKDSPNILLRESKVIESRIYIIIMKTNSKTPQKIEPNDLLIFEARQGSNMTSNLEIEISVREASESTGFSVDQVLPMGYFIIKKMLIVTAGYLALDFSVPKFDILPYVLKIQSSTRGFLNRIRIRKACRGIRIFSTQARIQGEIFTVSFFREREKVNLVAVKGNKCWNILLKWSVFDNNIDLHTFISKEVISSLYFEDTPQGKILCGKDSYIYKDK